MTDRNPLTYHSDLVLLLDFYGNLLTDKLQTVLQLAVNEDWSLSEISDEVGVTRQAVHDRIQRGSKALLQYEKQLGLVTRWKEQKAQLEELAHVLDTGDLKGAQSRVQNLLDHWDR